MRKKLPDQLPIVYPYIDHEHARELRRISDLLDQLPLAGELVYDDLTAGGSNVSTAVLACPATRSCGS